MNLLETLVDWLPASGTPLPADRREKFMRAFVSVVDLLYPEEGSAPPMLALPAPTELKSSHEPSMADESVSKPAHIIREKAKSPATARTGKAAHTGRHAFRDGVCTRDGCTVRGEAGAYAKTGSRVTAQQLADPKSNPFLDVKAEPPPQTAIERALHHAAEVEAEGEPRYCAAIGCDRLVGADDRCLAGHVTPRGSLPNAPEGRRPGAVVRREARAS